MKIDELTPGLHVLNAYFCSVVVDSLLDSVIFLLPLWDSVFFSMFCRAILVSILVLKSSQWGRES